MKNLNENQIFQYNGSPITFHKGDSVMVNATEMAKPFGKRCNDFLSTKQTNDLINSLSAKTGISATGLVDKALKIIRFSFGSMESLRNFVMPNNSKVFFLRRARLSLTILAGLFFMPNRLYENTRLSFLRNISSSEKILLLFGDTGNGSRFSVYNYNAKQ